MVDKTNATITPGALKRELAMPGRSQTALAKRLGVDPSAVNRMVNGRREIKARELEVIRAYLGETEAEGRRVELDVSKASPAARTLIGALGAARGTDLKGLIASMTIQVIDNIVIAIKPRITFSDDLEREAFWEIARNNFEALIILGLGANVIRPYMEDELRKLGAVASKMLQSGTDDVENDVEVLTAIREFLAPMYPDWNGINDIKTKFAIKTTTLALSILSGVSAAVDSTRELARAIESGRFDAPPPSHE